MSLLLLLSFTACSKDETDDGTVTDTQSSNDNTEVKDKTEVDLFLFAGGANMSGRSDAESSVSCAEGTAFEFKAVSDPTKLYPLTSDFGSGENKSGQINDTEEKKGGIVPAFCNAYYEETKTPIVAVSCSDGNNLSSQWKAGQGKTEGTLERLEAAKEWLEASEDYKLRHIYAVWLQGEADGDAGVDEDTYVGNMNIVTNALTKRGVEKIFVIQIGNHSESALQYGVIRQAQRSACEQNDKLVLVSDLFATMDQYLHDGYLYTQTAYDTVGADAGKNAASYVISPDTYEAPDHRGGSYGGNEPYDGPIVELPINPT